MDTLHQIEHWADRHHPKWIDFIRVSLGIFILYKGVLFISNTNALMNLIGDMDLRFFQMALAHYVAFAHIMGGILIALGLLTRLAVVVQLPILIGAVFFVNMDSRFLTVTNNVEFVLSLLVLVLLLVFLVFGSGKFSIDDYMKKHPNA
ncbi:DoxX family protein [Cyclobacterium jeungdonense]|uniref:DoxX family protein n=1 Tax=Cyclobacterium jeungdonense TaxID=708087 RepID=A0ABT8C8B8_9BACT|nr:DoxX family protein [Cyclobacterium jeungdonense]MDN3689033.1 DoxX family protein [Cyclobacterium jeungdonense]